MATVLSMVASSCMPPIAITAAMNRRDGNQAGDLPVRSEPGCSTCTGRAGLLRLRRHGGWRRALRH